MFSILLLVIYSVWQIMKIKINKINIAIQVPGKISLASLLFFTRAYLVLTTSSCYLLGTSIFPASRHMPCQFQHGGGAMYLSMAVESTSKSDIFRDVRFFLAEESNEEVCS